MKTLIVSSLVLVSSGVAVNSLITKDLEVKGQKTVYSIEQLNTLDTLSVENVYLSAINLSEIPENVFHFSNLEKLDLSSNSIVSIPKEIASLKKLNSLNLSDNPTIELTECFPNLSKLELKHLNISNCALVYLPYSVGQMKELTTLNVSNNALMDIPFYLGKLKKLEDLDLSANQLSSLDFTLYKMKNLKYLNLENNPNLDMKNVCLNLMALKNLNEVKFSHLKDTLPASFGNIKSFSLYISNSFISQLSPTISDNKYLQSITFKDCPETQFKTILPVLATVPSLTEVTLNNCFGELPAELKLLDKLTYLNLSGNQLSALPISQQDFPYLKQLVLYDNNFSEEEWKKIVSNFPNVDILSNNYAPAPVIENTSETIPNKTITPFREHLTISDTVITVKSNEPVIFLYDKTTINIPKNAFVNANGNPVKEPVVVAYREFRNPVDIFLSGIPMKYDSGGISSTFESGGMFEFNAQTSNGTAVFPNASNPISVDFNSTSSDFDFNEYSFNDSTMTWKFEQASTIDTTFSTNIAAFMPTARMNIPKPTLVPQNIYFDIKSMNYLTFYRKSANANETVILHPNILFKENIFKYYDPIKLKQAQKDVKAFNKKYTQKNINYSRRMKNHFGYNIPLVDFSFEIDAQKDCFVATFVFNDTLFELPVKLSGNGSFDREQKNYLTFWKKFQKDQRTIDKANKNIEKMFEKKLDVYEAMMSLTQNEYRSWLQSNETQGDAVIRNVILSSFGLWNIDRFGKMDNPSVLSMNILDENNEPFEANQFIVMDFTDNGVLTYGSPKICYDEANKTGVLALDNSNRMVYIDSHEFSKLKKDGKETSVSKEPISLESITKEEFKRILN